MVLFHPSACRPAAWAQPAVMCPPGFAPPACTLPGTPGTAVAQWKSYEQVQGKVLLFCFYLAQELLCYNAIALLLRQLRRCNVSINDTSSRCHREQSLLQWCQDRTFCSLVAAWHTAILQQLTAVHRKGAQCTLSPLCHWKPGPTSWVLWGALRLLEAIAWSMSPAHIPV